MTSRYILKAMYEKSLKIKLSTVGPEHPAAGDSEFNIALELAAVDERRGIGCGTERTNPRILRLFTNAHYAYKNAYGTTHQKTRSAKTMVEKYGGTVDYFKPHGSVEPEI